MGYAKRLLQEQLEEQERRGFTLTDKYVCARCFDDYAIKDFIKANVTAQECSFCGQRNIRKKIAADGNVVMEFLLQGIRSEYSTVDDKCVPWDSEDQKYIVPTYSIYDLVHDEHTDISSRPEVLEWIVDCIGHDIIWCEKDSAILSPEQGLIAGWEDFCEAIKHKTRFLFFEPRPAPTLHEDSNYVRPAEMLETLADTVRAVGLIYELPQRTELVRVRAHSINIQYATPAELGPPCENQATAGRMSGAGIPVFYGALEEATAIIETARNNPAASVGTFELLRSVRVLDLRNLPRIPSIFDPQEILRVSLRFLHHFRSNISEPIEPDGQEHIEYTPTQVISEFIRLRFRDDEGNRVEGVLYPSSRSETGTNVVLFIKRENVEGVQVEGYVKPEKLLRLLRSKTIRLPARI